MLISDFYITELYVLMHCFHHFNVKAGKGLLSYYYILLGSLTHTKIQYIICYFLLLI